jgi:hypothetical protein
MRVEDRSEAAVGPLVATFKAARLLDERVVLARLAARFPLEQQVTLMSFVGDLWGGTTPPRTPQTNGVRWLARTTRRLLQRCCSQFWHLSRQDKITRSSRHPSRARRSRFGSSHSLRLDRARHVTRTQREMQMRHCDRCSRSAWFVLSTQPHGLCKLASSAARGHRCCTPCSANRSHEISASMSSVHVDTSAALRCQPDTNACTARPGVSCRSQSSEFRIDLRVCRLDTSASTGSCH